MLNPTIPSAASERRPAWFLLVFALANIGGVIGYLPLLTLLLPVKIEGLAGEARIGLLTATIIAGAIAASLSNIAFGWLSDRSVVRGGGRRGWLAFGAIATAVSYGGVVLAASPAAIVLAIVLFQVAVNALLAPLFALMADETPDAQKGVAGALLALGNPAASAFSALLVGVGMIGETARFGWVALAVIACVAPLLLVRPRPAAPAPASAGQVALLRRDIVVAGVGRLLVQVAGNALSLYLLYYFESLWSAPPSDLAPRVGHLLTVAFIVPLPVALLVGRLSDRIGRRKPFLVATAAVSAGGLLVMALADGWVSGAIGFMLYATGSAVFLTLHAGFAMQLLPDPRRRGRDLGFYNLTNTLPALLGPLLTWSLATPHDFGAVMLVLAALTALGGVVMLAVRGRR